jgi:hypothetical protein
MNLDRQLDRASLRSRSTLPMIDTELKVMAALAIMGLSSSRNTGESPEKDLTPY